MNNMENLKTYDDIVCENECAELGHEADRIIKKEIVKWIKLVDEIEILSDKHLEVYEQICDEKRKLGEYPMPESDERYTLIGEEMLEKRKIFQDLGIKFGCNDYDGNPCLSLKGMKNVLMVIFDIKEEDLK